MGDERNLGLKIRYSKLKNTLKIVIIIALIFGAMQLIPIDRTVKPIDKIKNFTDLEKTPAEVVTLLRTSCYDCHSNQTIYPDYAFVAPISWMINDHVKEGRQHFNFSEWGTYNQFQKNGMLERSIHSLQDKKMPLPAYISKHPKANLTTKQRNLLIDYFRETLKIQSKH